MKKIALVTGSTKGIGRAIAQKLLEANYIVYINGRDNHQVEQTVTSLNNNDAKPLAYDMNQTPLITKAIDEIIKNEHRLDLLVGNIGSGKSKPFDALDIEEYRRIFDINFFNNVALCDYAVKMMQPYGGHIVLIASIAGCEFLGAPIAYSCAKTALLSFSKHLSHEVAKYNIRVNSISPGNVMFKGSTWEDKIKNNQFMVKEYISKNVPLNTFATPEDIAQAVLFLDNSPFITGSNLIIDGGQTHQII